jgi:hypothetical protein
VQRLFPEYVAGTPFGDPQDPKLADAHLAGKRSGVTLSAKDRLADVVNQSRILLAIEQAKTNSPAVITELKSRFLGPRTIHAAAHGATLPITDGLYNPDNPALRESWFLENGILKEMKAQCDQHGAEFWLIVLPREKSIDPDALRAAQYARQIGVNSLFLTDSRMVEQATAARIHAEMLGPELAKYAVKNHVALHGFFNTKFNYGHWNTTGNAEGGRLISSYLLRNSPLLTDLRTGTSQRSAGFTHHYEPDSVRCARTKTCSFSTFTSRTGWLCVAGPSSTRPSRRQKRD